jgi:hypothetical protein
MAVLPAVRSTKFAIVDEDGLSSCIRSIKAAKNVDQILLSELSTSGHFKITLHNAPHYTFFLAASGKLFMSAPSSAKPIEYTGLADCNAAFQVGNLVERLTTGEVSCPFTVHRLARFSQSQ